ncbi:hypothetical protein HPB50_005490 [Hyalomma asiaticum]|uniref:Uncharacterized protein n=1 Tax=Hyalomma asiaticum TaxID=266040 RepID=A0ACB7TAJ8_HYAAI|nr:hypothetical protein HPB50_005490 [Hyalomma asiaticum]
MPLNAAVTLPARAVHRYRNLSVSERVVFSCTACRNHSLNSCHPSRSSLHSCSSTFGSSKIPALLVDDAAVVVSVMLFRCRDATPRGKQRERKKKNSSGHQTTDLLQQMPHHAELGTKGQQTCQDLRNAIARGKAGTPAGTTAGPLHDTHPSGRKILACGET